MSGRELCEKMSAFLATKGVTITPRDIWNQSPSGELWPVYELHGYCVALGMAPAWPVAAPPPSTP